VVSAADVLKFRYRLGHESLCAEVSDSITWRRFCWIPIDGRDGYFRMVAYNGAVTPGVDAAVAHALQNSRSYRLAKIVLFQGAFAHAPYYIWVKR
jgi:hypothetical protein